MVENLTKRKLLDGGLAVGCFVRSPDATLAEYVATRGWDFLVFDEEHGSIGHTDVANLARAAERRDVTPMVRVSSTDPALVLHCLDSGASGLHFPWIDNVEQARAAVSAAKYWPSGTRGLAANRGTDWSVAPEATARANENTLTIVQIETKQGVDNIEELCAVEGVDVFFIGPSDLSQSLGVPGDLSHPLVASAMETVATAVNDAGKVLGLYAGTPDAAAHGMDLGARYVATGVEALIGPSMDGWIREVLKSH